MRIWYEDCVSPEAASVWRFHLDEPLTGRKRGFACLAELDTFQWNWAAADLDQ